MECLKPLDALVVQSGIVLAYEQHDNELKVSNDFMASPPWHPFWWMVIHEVKRRVGLIDQIKVQKFKRLKEIEANKAAGKDIKDDEEEDKQLHLDLTGVHMLTDVFETYRELYPDSAITILNDNDEVKYGGKKVIQMDGNGKKDEICSLKGDCSLKYTNEYVMKHYVESIEEETRFASTGSRNSKKQVQSETEINEKTNETHSEEL
jgi:hypothetical protein